MASVTYWRQQSAWVAGQGTWPLLCGRTKDSEGQLGPGWLAPWVWRLDSVWGLGPEEAASRDLPLQPGLGTGGRTQTGCWTKVLRQGNRPLQGTPPLSQDVNSEGESCDLGPYPFSFFCLFPFIFISWRLITLQYCSGFCHTLTWISHGFTCIPHPNPLSHLPLYPIPLGLPSAPAPSTCLMHPTWAGDLFHPR